MDPLTQGRDLYRRKDYVGAVNAFTEAIEISSDHLRLTALDHRAASYEKCDNLKASLRDSKEMIDLKPELSKGYLRCGKVLQLKGETELAMKIYERGLKKVKINTDDDRILLQHMFNKLKLKQSPTKCFDPLVMLPAELAEMVCLNLNMRDRVICLAVSKSWKSFLESQHELWTTLDLRRVKTTISKASLRAHFRRSNYGLTGAFLSVQKFDHTKLVYVTKSCAKLNHLELDVGFLGESLREALPFAKSLRSLIIGRSCQVNIETVVISVTSCPQLAVAEFHHVLSGPHAISLPQWPQLDCMKTFKLITDYRTQDRGFMVPNLEVLIKNCPNVEYVTLSGWQGVSRTPDPPDFSGSTQLRHIELLHFRTSGTPLFPKSLTHLDISFSSGAWFLYDDDGNPISIELPVLEVFKCSQFDDIDYGTAFKIIGPSMKAMTLKTLHMDYIYHGDDDPSSTNIMFPPCDSLEELSYVGSTHSEDQIVRNVLQYPNLKYLDISGTNITGYGIKQIMNREGEPLEHLRVLQCENMAFDAVEYAKARGTKVDYVASERKGLQRYYRDEMYSVGL